MNNYANISLFINIAAFVTILFGSLVTVGLISKSFLNLIFEHVDRLLKEGTNGKHLTSTFTPREANATYLFVKRVADIFFSILAIAVTIPIMIAVAVAIKFTSPGPVLLRQKRKGKGGKTFYAYKFRTMTSYKTEGALTQSTAPVVWNDPRVTKCGKFLRATGLDELPNYFNVLFGHMTMVGTSGASDHPYMEDLDPSVRTNLLASKPGIISLWALSGSRWKFNLDHRLPLDIYYVSHQSFSLDMAIFLMVVPSVLGRTASL